MDFVDRLSGRSINFDSLLKFSNLDVRVQAHLKRVYATLACALVVCAVGAYVNVLTGLGGMVSLLGSVGSVFWLSTTPNLPSTLNKRYSLLGVTAFLQGCSIGPLVGNVWSYNPGLIMTAFLGTAGVFFCFSMAALLSPRRSYLYLGGFLSASVLGLFVFRMFRASNFALEIYGGLLVFLLYIIFDTQMIVEKASAGDNDHVKAALDLFVDFVAVFVRLCVILMKKADEKERKRR
ncbi:hypothetical protein BSKO_07948 [Bryopsis sp. KO-2023]|nr:hypothetical protein BSKO_07948 [Bryopsis sp. KO-2023]